MRFNTPSLVNFSTAAILAALLPLLPDAQAQDSDSEIVPKAIHGTIQQSLHNQNGRPKSSSSSGINYHGGPLLATAAGSSVHVYVIWYGNWSGNTATTIIPNFLNAIGGSPYFKINTSYYNGSGAHVQNAVIYSGTANDNYSQGNSLGDAQIQAIVLNAISGGLPSDPGAVYFVLTSADVTETSGFCTSYCGWHTAATLNGTDIKYAFVGNPDRCPSACEAQSSSSPNNNPGADGMVSIIAHELEEATTDPDLNAWFDLRGYENADKCAWTFGTTLGLPNGSVYNMTLNGYNYLIQRNWVNAGTGYCALSY